MRILCESKGLVSLEKCFKCKHYNMCWPQGLLEQKKDTYYERKDKEIHVTSLIGCPLLYWLREKEGEIITTSKVAMTLGDDIHWGAERRFRQAYEGTFIEQKFNIEVEGWNIVGKPDGVLQGKIIDFKSTYKYPKSYDASPHHLKQIAIYTGMLLREGWVINEAEIQYFSQAANYPPQEFDQNSLSEEECHEKYKVYSPWFNSYFRVFRYKIRNLNEVIKRSSEAKGQKNTKLKDFLGKKIISELIQRILVSKRYLNPEEVKGKINWHRYKKDISLLLGIESWRCDYCSYGKAGLCPPFSYGKNLYYYYKKKEDESKAS